MAFIEELLREKTEIAKRESHPCVDRLMMLEDSVENDGVERISAQERVDVLEVPYHPGISRSVLN